MFKELHRDKLVRIRFDKYRTQIYLYKEICYFLWPIVECCVSVAWCWGNKLTTKLISSWSKFPISISHPFDAYVQRQPFTLRRHSCGRQFLSQTFIKNTVYAWEIFVCRFLCHLPSEKYPDCRRLNKFSRHVNENGNQTHKSHGIHIEFCFLFENSHKWHRISMRIKYSSVSMFQRGKCF